MRPSGEACLRSVREKCCSTAEFIARSVQYPTSPVPVPIPPPTPQPKRRRNRRRASTAAPVHLHHTIPPPHPPPPPPHPRPNHTRYVVITSRRRIRWLDEEDHIHGHIERVDIVKNSWGRGENNAEESKQYIPIVVWQSARARRSPSKKYPIPPPYHLRSEALTFPEIIRVWIV